MRNKFLLSAFTLAALSLPHYSIANPFTVLKAPQPTACIVSSFSKKGDANWSTVSLKLTNKCGTSVNFQNVTITFDDASNLQTTFWGQNGSLNPLAYPDNTLVITSQPNGNAKYKYTASMYMHFPEDSWANKMLPNGKSITLVYSAAKADYDAASVKVYLSTTPPTQTGEIDLASTTPQPIGVSQNYEVVDITSNGKVVQSVQLPWNGKVQIPGLAIGTYGIQPENVADSSGNIYQGAAVPASVTLSGGQKISSVISYKQIVQTGSINIKVAALPNVLSGYSTNPSVTLTRADTGSSSVQAVAWNATTTVKQLANNVTYNLSTPIINYNSNKCVPTFNPTSVTSSNATPPVSQLSYQCAQIAQDHVAVNLSGVPASTTSVKVTFTPSDNSTPVTQAIVITNGQGTGTVNLTDGVVYNVSSTGITGYTATYNPQPLTATSTAKENITFQKQATGGGRIIGYLPGWKTPPLAADLVKAGYTHVMVAFGVFSTSQPGQIVSAFDTVTAAYIQSLHAAGIKVLLSLGGASTSIANTSVNFHQVLSAAASPTAFQNTFVTSIENMMMQYGFDGFDIDIEQGLNASGTFTNPTGDIAVLAAILNKVHADKPNLLITLTPQVANVSATSGFDATWGNYASLIMQTYKSLSWVEIQLYNTGCAFGIDQVCYDPNVTNSPNFTVAMATDLLTSWPKTDSSGRATGFQPYVSYLTPNQVVIGYPSPNAQGASDGAPVTPTATIKRAIQCLNTGVTGPNSCGTYVPPKAYPGFGGVFNWEVTYDQANNYKFAKDLSACVLQGNCS